MFYFSLINLRTSLYSLNKTVHEKMLLLKSNGNRDGNAAGEETITLQFALVWQSGSSFCLGRYCKIVMEALLC